MKFKKIYIEITNNCNLNCTFCPKNSRPKKFIQLNEFKQILNKVKSYTNYLYFHVMGEPLLHPKINEFINLASSDFKVNITTNGYLIKRIEHNNNIRQINISLHSYNSLYKSSLNDYLNNILEASEKKKKNNTIINYRLWVDSPYKKEIISYLENYYHKKIELKKGFKLKQNVFIEEDKEFIWPDLNNNIYNENGKCYGLKNHIGILVDGTVIPCCLDCNAKINLGNIFDDSLENILKQEKVLKMIKGFQENKKVEELCKHCNFINK